MAPPAHQSGQAAVQRAQPRIPGLRRPCLESGRAWASATRQEEARARLAMSRTPGRFKVYSELLRQCRDGVSPADVRAVSSVAARNGNQERGLRKQLAALEAEGWIVTVHHAGIRLPGQRGWTTNVFVLPALLPAVQILPPAAREKARKLLLGDRVRDALMARGCASQLRLAVADVGAPQPPPPQPSKPPQRPAQATVDRPQQPAHNLSISTPMGLGSDFVSVPVSSSVTEISIVSPYPLRRPLDVDNSVSELVDQTERRPWPEALREGGTSGRDRPWQAADPERRGIDGEPLARPIPAGPRGGLRGELRGLKPSEAVAVLEAQGVPRSQAVWRAVNFSRVAAWRRSQRGRGDLQGRKPRWRALARAAELELARIREEKRRQGVELEPALAPR